MADLSWDEARRILAVRLDHLGDVLSMTPAFRAIMETETHQEVSIG